MRIPEVGLLIKTVLITCKCEMLTYFSGGGERRIQILAAWGLGPAMTEGTRSYILLCTVPRVLSLTSSM